MKILKLSIENDNAQQLNQLLCINTTLIHSQIEITTKSTNRQSKIDQHQITPLMFAAQQGAVQCAAVLLRANARVDRVTRHTKWRALHYAVDGGHVDVAELLIRHGADIEALTIDHDTPLLLAIGSVKTETKQSNQYTTKESAKTFDNCLNLLLSYGANVNICDKNGKTAMHLVQSTHNALLLLSHGAQLMRDKNRLLPQQRNDDVGVLLRNRLAYVSDGDESEE